MDEEVQSVLIQNALVPEDAPEDSWGRPKRIWNAVDGYIFVGVSVNLAEPVYNCYPDSPSDGDLYDELEERAKRSVQSLLAESGDGE
jgi:hypothetical protein